MTKPNQSLTRKVAHNTAIQVIGRIIIAVLAVITLRLTTGYLGSTYYGYLVTITSFIALFSTFTDWGLSTISGREIAKEPEKAEDIIGANIGLKIVISLIFTPLIIFTGYVLYADTNEVVRYGILLLSLPFVFNAVQSAGTAIFIAKVRNDIGAYLDVASKVLSLLVVYAVVSLDLGMRGYLFGQFILSVLMGAITLLVISRFVRIRLNLDMALWKKLFLLALPLGAIQIVNSIYFRIDSVILSVLRPASEVGYYGVGYRIIEQVMAVPGFIMVALLPALAIAEQARLRVLVQRAFDVMVTLALPLLLGSLLLSKELVGLITPDGFATSAQIYAILSFGAAASYLSGVFGHSLIAINKQNRLVKLSLVVVGVNIGANLLFIPKWGSLGAAYAMSLSEVFTLFLIWMLFTKETGVAVSIKQIPKSLIASALMFFSGVVLKSTVWDSQMQLLDIVGAVILLAIIYVILLKLLKGIPVDLKTNFSPFKKRVK